MNRRLVVLLLTCSQACACVLLLRSMALADSGSPTVIHVNQNATGSVHDGSSWAHAYTDLQTALSNAPGRAQVWVAKGNYSPGSSPSSTYTISSSVLLYGGFTGKESSLQQRDISTNQTILDGRNVVNRIVTDNAVNVRIDGFTIRGAHNSSVVVPAGVGGGIGSTISDSLTVANDIFTNNTAGFGGAIGILKTTGQTTQLVIENSVFASNAATKYAGAVYLQAHAPGTALQISIDSSQFANNRAPYGGAVYVFGKPAHISIASTRFANNIADTSGGALHLIGDPALVSIASSQFANNTADASGGAVYEYGFKNPASTFSATNDTFTGNTAKASSGGALQLTGNGRNLTVSDSTFISNIAGFNGAVLSDAQDNNVKFTNNIVTGNKLTAPLGSGSIGGVLDVEPQDGSRIIQNNLFANNSGADYGGIFYAKTGSGSVSVINNLFIHNSANLAGGVLYDANENSATPLVLRSNIFVCNTAPQGSVIWIDGSEPSLNGEANQADWIYLLTNQNLGLVGIDPSAWQVAQ